VADIVDLF